MGVSRLVAEILENEGRSGLIPAGLLALPRHLTLYGPTEHPSLPKYLDSPVGKQSYEVERAEDAD